jgi:putative peptidoglycan lipid II flippase
MSQMLKSSGAIGVATLTSRVLGMVREIVYANFMGDSAVASAFKLAFQIPNLFRRLLGEGALTAAFIPIFKEKERNAGEAEMWRAGNAVVSGLIASGAVIVAAAMVGLTALLALAPLEENTRMMLSLLRVMFPYMLLICVTAVFMGMLNSRGQFFVPALGAAVLNVILIASVWFVAPRWGKTIEEQIYAVAFGVLCAGVAQVAYQLPNLRREGFASSGFRRAAIPSCARWSQK